MKRTGIGSDHTNENCGNGRENNGGPLSIKGRWTPFGIFLQRMEKIPKWEKKMNRNRAPRNYTGSSTPIGRVIFDLQLINKKN